MATNSGSTANKGDLYSAIVTRIEARDLEGALALFNSVEEETQKRGLLLLINRVIIQNLTLVREGARNIDRDLARDIDRDLARSRDLERDLAIAITLELDIAVDLVIARELARSLARDLTFARELGRSYDLADIIPRIISAQRFNQFIIIALSGELTSRMIFEDIEILTPEVLRDDLVPYLQALFDLEKLLVEAKGDEFQQPKIKSINQTSPVRVEITRIPTAMRVFHRMIIPFWQLHEKKTAPLALPEHKLQLANEILGEDSTTEQLERLLQIIDVLGRKPPTLPEN